MSTPIVVSHLEAAAEYLKLARGFNEHGPAPSELIAARVMKPAQLTRRDLSAASNEFATDIAAAEDVIEPHLAPPRAAMDAAPPAGWSPTPGLVVKHPASDGPPSYTRHWYETPAPQDGTRDPGDALNGDGASSTSPQASKGGSPRRTAGGDEMDGSAGGREHDCPEAIEAAEKIERERAERDGSDPAGRTAGPPDVDESAPQAGIRQQDGREEASRAEGRGMKMTLRRLWQKTRF